MDNVLLDVKNLSVLYKRSILGIADISLQVKQGSTTAILGANGAGKTTTMRAITGFIGLDNAKVSNGTVRFADTDITGFAPHQTSQMQFVLVPEREKVFPNLTVDENLAVVVGETDEIGHMIYEFFPRLGDLKHKLAGLLSGGERQMLAIGAALAFKPKLLLIDELSLGLAPVIVEEITSRLERIKHELDLTMLIVEQNANMALKMADYAYALENGHVVLEGKAADLQENPEIQEIYLGGHASERRSYRDIGMEGLV